MWPQGWGISGHVVPTWFSWNVHFQNLATMPWDAWAKWRGHIVGALVNSASEPRLWVIPVALGFNYISPKICWNLTSNIPQNVTLVGKKKKKSHCRCNELGWGHIRVAQTVKNLPVMQETQVQSLGQEDPLEKRMATHCSILAWEMPSTEEPCGLQGSQRVVQDWVTLPLSYQRRWPLSMSSSEMRTPQRREHHAKTNTQGRWPHEDRGWGWYYAATGQQTPGSFQRLENTKKAPPLEPCQHLDFRFLDSRAARDYISVLLSHPTCSALLQQPSETHTQLEYQTCEWQSLWWCRPPAGQVFGWGPRLVEQTSHPTALWIHTP